MTPKSFSKSFKGIFPYCFVKVNNIKNTILKTFEKSNYGFYLA